MAGLSMLSTRKNTDVTPTILTITTTQNTKTRPTRNTRHTTTPIHDIAGAVKLNGQPAGVVLGQADPTLMVCASLKGAVVLKDGAVKFQCKVRSCVVCM